MKRLLLISLTCLVPHVTLAEDQADPSLSLMERGAQMFLDGILKEMEPALDEFSGLADEMGPALQRFATEMGPKLTELLDQVDDWTAYHAPEILPNGDIIMRRKSEQPHQKPETENDPAAQVDI